MNRYRVEITVVSTYLIDGTVGDEAAAIREALALHMAGEAPMYSVTPRVSVETVGEVECQQS